MGPHNVYLIDDGTLDTVISVNGREYRYTDVDREEKNWLKELMDHAIEEFEEEQAMHVYNPIGDTVDKTKCVECGYGAKFHFDA